MAARWMGRGLALVLLTMLALGGGRTNALAQSVDEIAALNKQVSDLYKAGKYAEAIPIAERALALGKQLADPKPPEVAATNNELARLYEKEGRAGESEDLYKRALAIYETANGPDDLWVAAVLHNLGLLYRDQARAGEAEPVFRRALGIFQKVAGPDNEPFRAAYDELVTLFESNGRYADLDQLMRQVLSVREQALGTDHPDVAYSLNQLGSLNFTQSRYREAEDFFKRAIAIRAKTAGPDSVEVAQSLNNLAIVYQGVGRHADAEATYKRALAIREKALGPDHVDVANSLNTLAQLYVLLSQYDEAEVYFKRSLAIFEKALGSDHRNVGVALGNLAVLYQNQGRSAEAEPLFRRTISVIEKALGPDHPFVGVSLNNLAFIYEGQKRYAEAEPLFKRALVIIETSLGPDHPDVGTGLNNLAALYSAQGQFGDAEPLLLRSVAIIEKALGPEHASVGTALNNLGILYRDQGRYAEAEQTFTRMMRVLEKALGPDHPATATGLSNIADLRLAQQDWRGAAENYRRSAAIVVRRSQRGSQDLGKPLTGGSKSEAQQSSYHFLGLIKAAARVAEQGGADPALRNEAFQAAQWAEGSEAAASLAQMAVRGAKGDAALAAVARERQDLAAEWQQRDAAHTAAAAQAPDRRDAKAEADNSTRLVAIEARLAVVDKHLATDFPGYAALVRPEPLSIAETQAQLGANEALVLFRNTHEFKPIPEETFIWVVTKTDSRWVRTDLGPAAIAEQVAALRCGLDATLWANAASWSEANDELARQKTTQVARRQRCEALVKAAPATQLVGLVPTSVLPFDAARAHALYKALFGEVEDLIRGKHLLVALDGALTSLPLSALVTEPPKEAIPTTLAGYRSIPWLGARQPITVLPSVASLKVLRATAKESRARRLLLGVGNPLLEGPAGRFTRQAQAARDKQVCPKEQPTATERLAAVRDRVMSSFRSVYRGAQADIERVREWAPLPETADELCEIRARLRVPESDILLGARAREEVIKELSESSRLADYQIVHFATHGALAGDVKGVAEPGLILTPPDQVPRDAAAADRDDGFLSASEIAALKLDANWVVLSACNTAAGTGEHAEALSGMARAFFYAGARALLVSHWEVGSQTAVVLTTRAFEELTAKPGIGRAEALRISMAALIEKGGVWQAHPSQWAPFVVVGEGGARR